MKICDMIHAPYCLAADRYNGAAILHQNYSFVLGNARGVLRNGILHVPVLVTRQDALRVQEYTQRSRSFLYAALACVVARLFGRNRFRFFENGVVSINLPISEQVDQ
jgi:hypothetical protein